MMLRDVLPIVRTSNFYPGADLLKDLRGQRLNKFTETIGVVLPDSVDLDDCVRKVTINDSIDYINTYAQGINSFLMNRRGLDFPVRADGVRTPDEIRFRNNKVFPLSKFDIFESWSEPKPWTDCPVWMIEIRATNGIDPILRVFFTTHSSVLDRFNSHGGYAGRGIKSKTKDKKILDPPLPFKGLDVFDRSPHIILTHQKISGKKVFGYEPEPIYWESEDRVDIGFSEMAEHSVIFKLETLLAIMAILLPPNEFIKFSNDAKLWSRQKQNKKEHREFTVTSNQKSLFMADWFDLRLTQNELPGSIQGYAAMDRYGYEGRHMVSHMFQKHEKVLSIQ